MIGFFGKIFAYLLVGIILVGLIYFVLFASGGSSVSDGLTPLRRIYGY